MIGFPKTFIDFSKPKQSSPLQQKWQDYLENQAQSYLENQDFFSRKTEGWKYFPFQKVMAQNFVFGQANFSLIKEEPSPFMTDSLMISVKNGQPFPKFKTTKDLFVSSWESFLKGEVKLNSKIKEKILFTLKKQRNPFCSLNNSLYTKGLILIIKKSLTQPLEIHYTQNDANDLQGINLRNFIFVEEEASTQIIEVFHGRHEEKPLFFNIQTDCFIDKEAKLEHSRLDKMNNQDTLINQLFAQLDKTAKIHFFSLSLNAGISRYHSELEQAENSASEIRGLSLLEENKYTDHKVAVVHKGIEGVSRQVYKSFLFDSAKQIFQGFISIEKPAQKSDTSQLSKNFLFGKGAFAMAFPELDISADDVKATHGATVSPFAKNRDLIFYLQSRGIEPFQALHLVLSGLIEEILSCLQANTKSILKSFITQKLHSLENTIKREFYNHPLKKSHG